jgi:hypothetical protein
MPTDPNTGREDFNAALLAIVRYAFSQMNSLERHDFFKAATDGYCTDCGRKIVKSVGYCYCDCDD